MNTCFTSFVLAGSDDVVRSVHDVLQSSRARCGESGGSFYPRLSDVLGGIGVEAPGCSRVEVYDYEYLAKDGTIRISTEGSFPLEGMKALKDAFPGLVVRYCAECFEDDIYESNDMEGAFFSSRYALDFETSVYPEGDPVEYFDDDSSFLAFVKEHFTLDYACVDDLLAHLDEDLQELDEDAFVSIHKMDFVEDLR